MNYQELKKIAPIVAQGWVTLCRQHTDTLEDAHIRISNSHFVITDEGGIHGDGAQEYTRFTWDAKLLIWRDDDEVNDDEG